MDAGLQVWWVVAFACALALCVRQVVRERRRRSRRVTLRLLRASALMSAHGHADMAMQLAQRALACARKVDALCEALAHERLGDIAQCAGDTGTSLRQWRLAAMMLHVGDSHGDAARVCLKVAMALDRAVASGGRRWHLRALVLQLAAMDEDGCCATVLHGPQVLDAPGAS